jgi:hypothetical protein
MNNLLEQVPQALRVGNVALGAVDFLSRRNAAGREEEYNRALRYIDTALQAVDTATAQAQAGQPVAWSDIVRQAEVHLDAAMSSLNALRPGGLAGWSVPVMPTFSSDPVIGQGATTALAPQGMHANEAMGALNAIGVRLRTARFLVNKLLLLEQNSRSEGGLSGISTPPHPIVSAVSLAMIAGLAWHGYGRTSRVLPTLGWVLIPGLFGLPGQVVALIIAYKQGFGQPKSKD